MPSLKDLRNRIGSVKNTQKITSAMKAVAASKLRRAQEHAEAGRPYAERMEQMLIRLASRTTPGPGAPKLMTGTGKEDTVLLLVVTSDRGLCGGFNAQIMRETRRRIAKLTGDGKTVKLFCVGRKGRDNLRRTHADLIVDTATDIGRPKLTFDDADTITRKILGMFEAGEFDTCQLIYNVFVNAITQRVSAEQIVPTALPDPNAPREELPGAKRARETVKDEPIQGVYEFEPSEEDILADLLPRNVAVQVFKALLDSAAGEQGARMNAMDSATRNAGDLIKKLTLEYNRSRQAAITKELIEIVSGAEAL